MRMRGLLGAVLALILVTGCASTSPVATGSTDGADATPTSSPTQTNAVVAVVMSSDGLRVEAAGGEILSVVGWQDPATMTVPILTKAFGAAPTTRVFDASAPLPRTEYVWGGFVLQVDAFTEQSAGNAATSVHARTASVGDVSIRMANGIAVGSTRAAAVAAGPDPSSTGDGLNFDPLDLGGGMMSFVTATLTGDSVSSIDSPIHNYGY